MRRSAARVERADPAFDDRVGGCEQDDEEAAERDREDDRGYADALTVEQPVRQRRQGEGNRQFERERGRARGKGGGHRFGKAHSDVTPFGWSRRSAVARKAPRSMIVKTLRGVD